MTATDRLIFATASAARSALENHHVTSIVAGIQQGDGTCLVGDYATHRLPWRCAADIEHLFRSIAGSVVVVTLSTWDGLPASARDRVRSSVEACDGLIVVLSRDATGSAEAVCRIRSAAPQRATVIGGPVAYRELAPIVTESLITAVTPHGPIPALVLPAEIDESWIHVGPVVDARRLTRVSGDDCDAIVIRTAREQAGGAP